MQGVPFGIIVCGIEELAGHTDARASHVLSILDPDHPVPEAFGRFGEHCKLELRFHDIVDETPGEVAPQLADVQDILAFGRALAGVSDPRLLIHCHAGISRSTAAMTLILAQALPDRSAEDVLGLVHDLRGKAWPNLRMIEFGDALLGRAGGLVHATSKLHRVQLERRPDLAVLMAGYGRQREIDAAGAA